MNNMTVLFVDDEQRLLNSLKREFMDEPFKKLFANSGEEALELLKDNKVHVIVTDMRMPDMNGLDLLREVKQKYPKIVRMVLSGYTQVTTLLTAINQGEVFKYITKPWQMEEEFKPAVKQALEYYMEHNKQEQEVKS